MSELSFLDELFAKNKILFGELRMEAEGSDPATAAPAPDGAPEPTDAPVPDTAAVPTRVQDLPDWAQAEIRKARDEAAKNRVAKTAAEQQQSETMAAVAKALGLQQDETPDPAKLERSLADREQRVAALEADSRAKDIELAAWRAASREGVDASSLLDSRSFLTSAAKLDPSDDGFNAALTEAVRKAVADNPRLRAGASSAAAAGIGVTGGGDSLNNMTSTELLSRGYSK